MLARRVESAAADARSLVVDSLQIWSEFATPRFNDLIIYQAPVGSFAGLHDHLNICNYATFDDFQTKLGYIRSLGFNAIQLLPISQVDGVDSEGYSATNLFAPHDGYGPPEKLRSLVDTAHQHGLAVIFDAVYHQASTAHNHYWQYDGNTTDEGGIYFEDPYRDEPLPDEEGRSFAHWKIDVHNFFLDHARMLLDKYQGDGIRFDMAHSITWDCLERASPQGCERILTGVTSTSLPRGHICAKREMARGRPQAGLRWHLEHERSVCFSSGREWKGRHSSGKILHWLARI